VINVCCEQADGSLSEHCTDILDTWLQMSDQADGSRGSTQTAVTGFDSAIHNLIAKQTEEAVVKKPEDAEEAERKKAILAQYAHLSDGEEYPLCGFSLLFTIGWTLPNIPMLIVTKLSFQSCLFYM